MAHLINLVAENAPQIERISIMHAACDDIDAFTSQVQSLVTSTVIIGEIGPVVGAHAGLGTIGVVFQTKN
jgi:fatty acid-binding protein DegV